MQYMRDTFDFSPSKRAFQTQFRRWEFPSKQNPAHRNVDLVSRVKELWEQNYSQRDMLSTLNDEGYEIKERELMRVRAKNRWLLRIPNGAKPTAAEESFEQQLLDTASDEGTQVPEDVLLKRKERHDKLQAESDERWAAKKRRRRTRDYAGIAADPPGPPRFPSETTLAEGMEFLLLDKKQYKEVREHFQRICEAEDILKKTLAGAEKWQAAKNRLIRENQYLQPVFNDGTNIQAKELALDVICTDVTKRMRTVERRMTIVDSKNTLGINPEQSRQIRNAFYQVLQSNHFTSKLETGHEHWQQLKNQWISSNSLLGEILAGGSSDPNHEKKLKALEVLCRDVMKRLRDDHKKKGGSREMSESMDINMTQMTEPMHEHMESPPLPQQIGQLDTAPVPTSVFESFDGQIDPSLLQDSSFTLPLSLPPIPVYIRPHSQSQTLANEKLWLTSITSRTVDELYTIISQKWPNSSIIRINGVEKGSNGQELSCLIEEDDELNAYLDHVQNRKATFLVTLNPN